MFCKEFVTDIPYFYWHSIFNRQPKTSHFVLCYATHIQAPCWFCFLPCVVCSCVGNCSNTFPNIVDWEGKHKMCLHRAWFECRILREKNTLLPQQRWDNVFLWKLWLFSITMWLCLFGRVSYAKAARWLTLQSVLIHSACWISNPVLQLP